MKVLRNYDLSPDGVKIAVDWDTMHVNTSIFILCINTEEAKKQVKNVFVQRKWQFLTKIWVENGCLGLRVWRTL
jgi:hypothetical protein